MKAAEALRLKNAIDLARAQVQDLADNGFEPSRLASCLQRLDSAVLAAAELKTPPALSAALDECVKSCASLAHRSPASAHVPALPMIRILLSAPDYVDFLAAGNADCPAAWSDLINDSRRQRGESPLFSESAEPVNPYAAVPSLPPVKKMSGDAEVISVYRNIKPLLRQCVKLEFTAPTQDSAQGIHLLLSKVSEITVQGPVRTLFWVVSLLHASVASGSVPRTPDVLRAGLRASATLTRLARSGLKSKSDASAANAVRRVMDVPFFTRDADLFDATFCLRSGTVEDAEEIRHVRDVLRGVSGKTISDFRAVLMAALAAPLSPPPGATPNESCDALKRAAAALHVIGMRHEAAVLELLILDAAAQESSLWHKRANDVCQGVLNELDDRSRRFACVRSWPPGQTPPPTQKPTPFAFVVAKPHKIELVSAEHTSHTLPELDRESNPPQFAVLDDPAPTAVLDDPAPTAVLDDPAPTAVLDDPAPLADSFSFSAPAWDFELIDVVPTEQTETATVELDGGGQATEAPKTDFSSDLDDDLSWTPPTPTDSISIDPNMEESDHEPAILSPISDDADPLPIHLGSDISPDLQILSDDLLTSLTLWARDPSPERLDVFRLSARTFLDGSRKHVHHHAAQSNPAPVASGSWSPPKAPPKIEPPAGLFGKIKALMATDRKS